MTPIIMRDTLLNTDVTVYQIGLPDPFGANVLTFFDGTNANHLLSHPDLSSLYGKKAWMTININRLEPKS